VNVGEPNPELRRIFLSIYVADGTALALDAAVAPPVGSVRVSVNGAAFVNAAGSLVHMGAGSYYYQADTTEVASAGFLSVEYKRTGYKTEHDWAQVGRLFLAGETNPALLRLPLTIYDLGSPPGLATGATVTTASDLQVSINGNAYANSTGSLHEVGDGLYYYQAVAGDVAVSGAFVAKFAPAAGFALTISWQSVDSVTASSAPSFTSVTAPGPLDADPTEARWTPVDMVFSVPPGFNVSIAAVVGLDSALWMLAYDEVVSGEVGQGALAPLYEDKSVVTSAGSVLAGRVMTMSILPNGGWQRPDVTLVAYLTLEVT
jgi:hypothetical protein